MLTIVEIFIRVVVGRGLEVHEESIFSEVQNMKQKYVMDMHTKRGHGLGGGTKGHLVGLGA